MKSNKLVIKIKKPVDEVFTFTLNPKNTPLWINSIVREKASEQPAKLGTVYKNLDKNGKWSEYTITSFEENNLFEFTSNDGNYKVRYIFRPIDNNTTEFEYYEWVEKGELEKPFTNKVLNNLKSVLED